MPWMPCPPQFGQLVGFQSFALMASRCPRGRRGGEHHERSRWRGSRVGTATLLRSPGRTPAAPLPVSRSCTTGIQVAARRRCGTAPRLRDSCSLSLVVPEGGEGVIAYAGAEVTALVVLAVLVIEAEVAAR